MRRLIMWNLVSVDGLFEGDQPWDLGWHDTIWGDELDRISVEQLETAGALLFGRRTYEGMAAYWPTSTETVAGRMNEISKVVFSRTLADASWANTALERGDAVAAVGALKRQEGGDLFVFGSAALSKSLGAAGLFDEYRIAVAPVILGSGSPLFGRGQPQRALRLLESRSLASGGVVLRYQPIGD
jgi:dihydrofolate reductase